MPLKVLISAAEASADAHGAALLSALKREHGPGAEIDAFGVGGPKLRAAGLRTVVDAKELLAMGFQEVLGRLPKILRALRTVTEAARSERPDVAVVIDYPDFHFLLARRLKRLGIPVVYFIPPKVWVWRKRRIRVLRERFAKLLCIFPFEEKFYSRNGLQVKFVGNPLIDELPLSMSRQAARDQLGLGPEEQVLALMPGSRPSELKRHVPLFAEAACRAGERLARSGRLRAGDRLRVLVPLPDVADPAPVQAELEKLSSLPGEEWILWRVSRGDAHACLIASDAGLIKSGTSTLEAGLLGCPHAVVFRTARSTEWLFKNVIRYRGPVGLVNLAVDGPRPGPWLVREILCGEATVGALADEAVTLLTNSVRRAELQAGFERLRREIRGESSGLPGGPSALAAREILQLCPQERAP